MNHSYDDILLLDSLKLDMEFFLTAFLQSGQSDPPFRSDRLHVSIEDLSAKFSPQKYVQTPSTAMLSIVAECGPQGWNLKVASTDRTLRKVYRIRLFPGNPSIHMWQPCMHPRKGTGSIETNIVFLRRSELSKKLYVSTLINRLPSHSPCALDFCLNVLSLLTS